MALPVTNQIEVTDYLAFEKSAVRKHEFYDGYLIAMIGATQAHRDIQTNTITLLTNQFRSQGRPCRAHGFDTRVAISEQRYFYPDVTVFCCEIQEDATGSSLNPETVIEILSESTEKFDRNEKSAAYKENASIREIVLIDSRSVSVVIFKKTDEFWSERNYSSNDEVVEISGLQVKISDLYSGVF